MLVGYQLDRAMAQMKPELAARLGGRSNGCAYADSSGHIPIQRMANVSLQPAPDGPSTEELIGRVERGIYVVGDKSWSIDMQRFNFQFTGQRFYKIADGELVGQLRDVAYQATTTDFWNSMEAVGGPRDLGARRRVQLRQGPARPGRLGQPRLPDIALPEHPHPQHHRRGRPLMTQSISGATPQSLVEHALATSTADDCIAIVRDQTSANLRWANNTLTTNGVMLSVSVTVISFVRMAGGVASGSVSGKVTTTDQVSALVEAADAAARAASPAEDANDLVTGDVAADWDDEPVRTDIHVYDAFAPALGEAFGRAGDGGRVLYGFVNHELTTTYLGSSTGLRLRHVQPTGHYGCTGKTADLTQSAWVGGATRDFADVDPLAFEQTLATRLGWGSRRVDLPAGRYDTILPPTAVADLLIYAYWSAGARVAHEGQSVYSDRTGGTLIDHDVSDPGVTLFSDPTYAGLDCAPFVVAGQSGNTSSVFDNGLPLDRTDWIRKGELSSLIQTRHSAAMTGQPVTPVIDNLVLSVDGGAGSVEDMVAGTERGLLLTCLWYIREVDPQNLLLTGLTRDGVYLVENGEITGAVNNFRLNESPVDLLRRFSHAGATVPAFSREWGDYFPRTAMPALRVPDFNMSSVSQAL